RALEHRRLLRESPVHQRGRRRVPARPGRGAGGYRLAQHRRHAFAQQPAGALDSAARGDSHRRASARARAAAGSIFHLQCRTAEAQGRGHVSRAGVRSGELEHVVELGTVEILERLVGFPTVSRDSNLPLIDWVRNYLAGLRIDSHLVPNAAGCTANLFASVGPQEQGGLVLSGHTDVVPVDGQPWTSDPFKLATRDARLHARGACDMKGFIAAALSRVPSLKAQKLRRPVHFMFSYDEEIGCLGAPSMIAAASRTLPKPAVVI